MKAKSKVNAYNLELQPCTILILVCCIFWKNNYNQAACLFFHQNPSLRKKKRKSFEADAEEESENQGLCPCRLVGLAICLSVPVSIYLSVCRLVGWSVCLSVSISVCLAFYIEQKVIYEASAFSNLLFVCSFFANWSKSFDSLVYLSCRFTRFLIYFV